VFVGIISDTHDNLPLVEKAVKYFNEKKVDHVLHAGDFTSPFVIPKFKTLNCRLTGVFGNNDGDHEFLRKRCNETGNCEIRGRFAEIDFEHFKIALLHGDETELLDALVRRDCFDAVVYGHAHVTDCRTNGRTLIVNPGELCAYLTGKSTLAMLDTVKREAEIVEL
jgi:putative phosphoesterase